VEVYARADKNIKLEFKPFTMSLDFPPKLATEQPQFVQTPKDPKQYLEKLNY
jgi:hypothetical protein